MTRRWSRRGATAENINSPELVEIYLLRHGQTAQSGTYTGITDVSLSAEGKRQIRALIPIITELEFDHCFCSPLLRCIETYALLDIGLPYTDDKDLKEINFGSWEGLTFQQIQKDFADQLNQWEDQGDSFTFPGGERISSFNERVKGWFGALLANDFNRVLIVAHGGVLRIGLCHLLGVDEGRAFAFNFKEGALTHVAVNNGSARLEFHNCRG